MKPPNKIDLSSLGRLDVVLLRFADGEERWAQVRATRDKISCSLLQDVDPPVLLSLKLGEISGVEHIPHCSVGHIVEWIREGIAEFRSTVPTSARRLSMNEGPFHHVRWGEGHDEDARIKSNVTFWGIINIRHNLSELLS